MTNIRPDEYGLLDRLMHHKREQGGTLTASSGIQGSTKTNALQVRAAAYVDAGETVLWRGRPADVWHAFPGKVKIWSTHPLAFVKVDYATDAHEPLDVPYTRFVDAEDLVERAQPGVLNVFYHRHKDGVLDEDGKRYARAPFMGRLVKALVERTSTRWMSLFIDEAHEVWPDRPQGADWHYQRDVRDNLADFRKTFNSLDMATHHYDELDEAILKKMQFLLYFRGAKPPGWTVLRNKAAPMTLAPGEAIIESGNFGKVSFARIPRPAHQVRVLDVEGLVGHDEDEPATRAEA